MIALLKIFGDRTLAALKHLRRTLGIMTDGEARLAYVDEAKDRIDLERRMRELDRSTPSFRQHQAQGWRF